MGGIRITVPACPAADISTYAVLTLSEELTGEYGTGGLLYPMRTGNHYKYTLTLDQTGPAVFEMHEYALFRYGALPFLSANLP
jgi:hypothetical protein